MFSLCKVAELRARLGVTAATPNRRLDDLMNPTGVDLHDLEVLMQYM